jgi:dephospho-CoA kinase
VEESYRIGVTGLIGTGKSQIIKILEEMDVAVLDVDKLDHQIYETEPAIKESLLNCFGKEILGADGKIDQKALDNATNKSLSQRMILERLVHMKVTDRIDAFYHSKAIPQRIRAVVMPLLFEAQMDKRFDEVWVVVVEPEEELLKRLMSAHPELTQEDAKAWMNSQWPQAELAEKAYRVIKNSGTLDETRGHIRWALKEIRTVFQGVN